MYRFATANRMLPDGKKIHHRAAENAVEATSKSKSRRAWRLGGRKFSASRVALVVHRSTLPMRSDFSLDIVFH